MKLDPIGELFSKSWRLFRERFDSVGLIFLPSAVLILISQLVLARQTSGALLLGGVINILGGIASFLASLALISAFGKGTDFGESYQVSFKLFWASIWIAILVGLVDFGGFVMLIVPGIMLAFQLAFASYALVLEGKHGMSALVQSREYVKGYWWPFVGRSLLLLLCLGGCLVIIFFPANLIFGHTFGSLIYAILLFIFTPFSVAYNYQIFENFRRLKPAVNESSPKAETGFLKVSMIVGIIGFIGAIILFFVALIFIPKATTSAGAPQPNSYNYTYPSQAGVGAVPSTLPTP